MMYAVALLELLGFVFFLLAFMKMGVTKQIPLTKWLILFAYFLVSMPMVIFLAGFLRHFYRDPTPFGQQQSRRLVVAACLLCVQIVLGAMLPPVGNISLSVSPIPISVSTSQDSTNLNVIILVVFLFCLASLVRYGNALKEDSDSIL
jgi:magnesium-transporting ATPase (P-type)